MAQGAVWSVSSWSKEPCVMRARSPTGMGNSGASGPLKALGVCGVRCKRDNLVVNNGMICDDHLFAKMLPKSEHVAGNVCVAVVKRITTHSSPGVVVVDFKTSGIRWSAVTSKSNRHYTHTLSKSVKLKSYMRTYMMTHVHR